MDTRVKRYLNGSVPWRVAVGDVVTTLFLRNHIQAHLFIVDLRVERKKKYSSIAELGFSNTRSIVRVRNAAGTVTASLTRASERAVGALVHAEQQIIRRSPLGETSDNLFSFAASIIQVEGEEDLAVLPVVLALPLGSQVFYGQPRDGVVVVDVTENRKEEAYELLRQFKPRG